VSGISDAAWRSVSDFAALRASGVTRVWIASELLSGDLRHASDDQPFVALCAINGLILLHHGVVFQGRIDPSSISMTNEIRNLETDEAVRHDEYGTVFDRLNEVMRPDLVYTTTFETQDGTRREDRRLLMTEGAQRASASGVPFSSLPGRRLPERKSSVRELRDGQGE
jgi:hypothetical protein